MGSIKLEQSEEKLNPNIKKNDLTKGTNERK
jgi:hypothetical protein